MLFNNLPIDNAETRLVPNTESVTCIPLQKLLISETLCRSFSTDEFISSSDISPSGIFGGFIS